MSNDTKRTDLLGTHDRVMECGVPEILTEQKLSRLETKYGGEVSNMAQFVGGQGASPRQQGGHKPGPSDLTGKDDEARIKICDTSQEEVIDRDRPCQ